MIDAEMRSVKESENINSEFSNNDTTSQNFMAFFSFAFNFA